MSEQDCSVSQSDSSRPQARHDIGDHLCLSEDWLHDNLPEGWEYDCQVMTEQMGFVIYPPTIPNIPWFKPEPLFIPLDLLKMDRRIRC